MYYSLTGKLVHIGTGSVAVDCGGVAYYCKVSLTTLSNVGQIGSDVTVYTYLAVRDNAMDLYAFSAQTELSAFKLLITVTGIGPKMALGILSFLSPEQLALSVAADDYKSLTSAPGVGSKTAQRIVLELKDKVKTSDAAKGITDLPAVALGGGNINEAISALMVLGYSQTQAATVLSATDKNTPVQELIKYALKALADRS